MKYKDKIFLTIVFLHLFIFGNGVIGIILVLSACFISLEYPLKHRRTYFWLLIIIYAVLLCLGFCIGVYLALTNININIASNGYVIFVLEIALVLTLYYRDNEDFIFREKVKELAKNKSMDKDSIE